MQGKQQSKAAANTAQEIKMKKIKVIGTTGRKIAKAYLRNLAARARNAAIRELCGTSAAAARRDGGV